MDDAIEILLVEDDLDEVLLAQEMMQHIKLINNLHVVNDGHSALAFLRSEGQYSGFARPDLILIDYSLPPEDGFALMQEIRRDAHLAPIPIILLLTPELSPATLNTGLPQANHYLHKPLSSASFFDIAAHISEFWMSIVRR